MQLLESKPIVDLSSLSLKTRSAKLIDSGVNPQLAVLLVGEHLDSVRYIAKKTEKAQELGIIVSLYHMEEASTYAQIEETISFLNQDPEIHGIILQLPLPGQFTDTQIDALLSLVAPEKDVDGLQGSWKTLTWKAKTLEELQKPFPFFLPPMVLAVLSLLDYYDIQVDAGPVVIIGKGRLVGDPLTTYLTSLGCEVVTVDEETENILEITKKAHILITGTGERDLVTYQWITQGAVVVDCAFDVHRDSVSQVASALAPSIGGVGPLTVLWLLHNTIQAAENAGGI